MQGIGRRWFWLAEALWLVGLMTAISGCDILASRTSRQAEITPTPAYSAPTATPRNLENITIAVDMPLAGAVISGTVHVAGWAVDPGSTEGTGIDAVHLHLDGTAESGVVLGIAAYGGSRPDVAKELGQPFTASGFNFFWDTTLTSNGPHTLYVSAHSPALGWKYAAVPLTINNGPR